MDTSQEWWKRDLAKYKTAEWQQKGIELDFSDAQIRVELLNDDGTFGHEHVNTIRLEQYQPEDDWDKCSPMDKLLIYAGLVHRGEGSLEELYILTMNYQRVKKRNE